MSLDFQTYLKAKNNFCFCYNGQYKEFIWQLLQVRKYAKKQFPELNIFISCIPEIYNEIKEEGVINADEFKNHLFLKTQEVTFNMVENPVLEIARDAKLEIDEIEIKPASNRCHIITETKIPFKKYDLNKIKNYLSRDYEIVNKENADVLFAVECEELYKWAYLNKKTVLLKIKENEETYKNLFPGREILNTNDI